MTGALTRNKLSVLFVDDEEMIINGLKRNMRQMRKEWEMHFALSGEAALEILATQPCDVIVSDMRMPNMSGADLLMQVRDRYPRMVRLILSGYSEQELVMRSVNVAHRFLAKPTEPDELRSVIQRCHSLRQILHDDGIARLIAQVQTLPSPPHVYRTLLQRLQAEGCSVNIIAQVIEDDPAMTIKLLKMVNSSFFGIKRRVTRISEAVTYLGTETIKTLALSAHIFEGLEDADGYSLDTIWRHSAAVASMAREVMATETDDTKMIEEAYTAGLLHDIGRILLATELSDDYREVLRQAEQSGRSLTKLEKKTFGVSHAEVGAYLLGLWGLPDTIVEAVAFHHHPQDCVDQSFSILTAVHIANGFYHLHQDREDSRAKKKLDSAYFKKLDISQKLPVYGQACSNIIKKADSHAE